MLILKTIYYTAGILLYIGLIVGGIIECKKDVEWPEEIILNEKA